MYLMFSWLDEIYIILFLVYVLEVISEKVSIINLLSVYNIKLISNYG